MSEIKPESSSGKVLSLGQYLRRAAKDLLIFLSGNHYGEFCYNANKPFRKLYSHEATPHKTTHTVRCSECNEIIG